MIIDEWNFDRDQNMAAERGQNCNIAASFIPQRLKHMAEAGIDNQVYYCLENFAGNKEGVNRNVGVFSFEREWSEYKGAPKCIYNVFQMLNSLGPDQFGIKLDDEFTGAIATKTKTGVVVLVFNYVDPDIALNYLSRNVAGLRNRERNGLLRVIESGQLEKILAHQLDIRPLPTTNRVDGLLTKAQALNDAGLKKINSGQNIKINFKGLKGNYKYSRYVVDASCRADCDFSPQEEKEIAVEDNYQENLKLEPYSVQLVVLDGG